MRSLLEFSQGALSFLAFAYYSLYLHDPLPRWGAKGGDEIVASLLEGRKGHDCCTGIVLLLLLLMDTGRYVLVSIVSLACSVRRINNNGVVPPHPRRPPKQSDLISDVMIHPPLYH
jgi:hypothetical protein